MPRSTNFFIILTKTLIYTSIVITPILISKNTSEIFEIPKMLTLYFITTLILVFASLTKINFKNVLKENFLKLFIFFLFTQILSFIFSIDKYISFFGYYTRLNGGVMSLIYFFILSSVTLLVLRTKNEVIKFLKISILTSSIISLIGILTKYKIDLLCLYLTREINNCWQKDFNPEVRIFSTLGQPNWLAAYLNINLFFILYFLIKEKKEKIWYFLYILNLVALTFTGSISGLLAFFLSFCLILITLIFAKEKFIKHKIKTKKLIFITLISFLTIIATIDKQFIKQRIQGLIERSIENNKQEQNKSTEQIKEINDSGKIRIIVWKGAINLWKKYPLFGTGPETFAISYYFARPKEHNFTTEWNFVYNKVHNEFLNYVANTGIIGFLGFLTLSIYPYYFVIKNLSNKSIKLLPIFLLTSLTTIHITNFFGFSTSSTAFYLFIIPALIVNLFKSKNKKEEKLSTNFNPYILMITFFSAVFSFNLISKFYLADKFYNESQQAALVEDYATQIEKLQSAIQTMYHPHYANELAVTLTKIAPYYNQKQHKKQLYEIQEVAIYYNTLSLKDSPKNIFYLKTRIKLFYLFYELTGNKNLLEEAIKTAQIANKLAPTEPQTAYLLSLTLKNKYLNNKKMIKQKVLPILEETIKLKPNYIPAQKLKAEIIFILYGKEKAISYLENINNVLKSEEIKSEIIKLKKID